MMETLTKSTSEKH